MPHLACFIHSTTLEVWKDSILITLLERLKQSGLLYELKHLCIINTGQPLDITKIERLYPPAVVVNWAENTMDFEICTIKQVVTYAKLHPDSRILYMHTKGVSYPNNHVFLPGIKGWINYMLYSLVDNYKKCKKLLNVYDTVGCNYRPDESGNMQHYSGNFWWTRADYVKKLPISRMKDKYEPEFWVLQNRPFLFNIFKIEHMYEQPYYIEDYKEFVDRGLDENIFFCKLGFHQAGLCNQLYSLANTLTIASLQEGNKVIILNDFITEISTTNVKPSKFVIDFDNLNDFLKPYKIHVIYKNDVNLKIKKIEYGLKHKKVIDVTTEAMKQFWKDNHLYIPIGYSLNDLKQEDPCPQMRKQLYVYYTINDIEFVKVFHERVLVQKGHVEIKHSNYDGKSSYFVNIPNSEPWLTLIDRDSAKDEKDTFDHFLTNIPFLSVYHNIANEFLKTVTNTQPSQKISVFHIRNEDDAIDHWAKKNNIPNEEYKSIYETKFKNGIQKLANKSDLCVALTFFTDNNPIIEDMRKEGYNIVCRPNMPNIGREMNALIDLLLCKSCTQCFIGNFDPISMQGSTFSIMIHQLLKDKNVSKGIINIENIKKSELFITAPSAI